MSTHDHTQNAMTQIASFTDELTDWIISRSHQQPDRIVHLPEGVHDLTPEQSKRMADEYDMVARLIAILAETKSQLIAAGARPLQYDEEIALRFNALVNPNTPQMIAALYNAYRQTPYVSEGRSLGYIKHLETLLSMFERIAILRNAYAHILFTTSHSVGQ